MKKLLFLFITFFVFQNGFTQPVQQLDELVVVEKKMKNFKVSKGKKAKNYPFNSSYYYYYVLDSLPYGYLNKLTIYYITNFGGLNYDDTKNAKNVYENWCASCLFDVNIYDYENGELIKLTEQPVVITLEKIKKILVKKTIDFSSYNLVGSQFVLSITPSKQMQDCKNCATYGISLFTDEKESLFEKDKNKFVFGKGLKYDLEVRSKKY